MLVEAIEDLVGEEDLVDGLTPDGLADVLLIVFQGALVELSMDSELGVEQTRRAFEQSITLIESAGKRLNREIEDGFYLDEQNVGYP